jgi:hypothetical protein
MENRQAQVGLINLPPVPADFLFLLPTALFRPYTPHPNSAPAMKDSSVACP